jgi:hypothetical protein
MSGYSNRTDYTRLRVRGDRTPGRPGSATPASSSTTLHRLRHRGLRDRHPRSRPTGNRVTGGRFANATDILVLNKPWPAAGPGRELHIEGVEFAGLDPGHAAEAVFNGRQISGRHHVCLLPMFVWADAVTWQTAAEDAWWPNLFDWRQTFGPSDAITLDGEYLAFEEWGRDWPLPSMVPASVRLKADGTVKTSGEIYDERGWALWGRVPVEPGSGGRTSAGCSSESP